MLMIRSTFSKMMEYEKTAPKRNKSTTAPTADKNLLDCLRFFVPSAGGLEVFAME